MDCTNLHTNKAQYPAESKFNKITGEKKMKSRNFIKNIQVLLQTSRMQLIKTSLLQDLYLQCKQNIRNRKFVKTFNNKI